MDKPEILAQTPALYLKALSNNDLDGVLSLYADDAVLEDPVGSEPYVGIDRVREFYANVIDRELDAQLSGQVRVAGNEVAFPFICKDPAMAVAVHVIDIFQFNDQGKIASMRAFWSDKNIVPL